MPTEPLVQEIERAFPERPFTVELWDGSRLPSTNGGGPTFTARSPDALAYAVSAPGPARARPRLRGGRDRGR